MDFSFTDEQQLIRDSLARYLDKEYGFAARRAILHSETGWSRAVWTRLAEMGVLGVALPEAHGGFGGGPIDTLLVMTELGRALVVEPYLPTVVLGAGVVELAGSPSQQAAILPAIAQGQLTMALAHGEPTSRWELPLVETRAEKQGAGFVLRGRKSVVAGGGQADRLVVSARTAGDPRDARGISLFLVDKDAHGLTVRDTRTIDGQRAAEVTLDGVALGSDALLGALDGGLPILERVWDRGAAALAAEAVGVMEKLHALTVEHLKTRHQFGQPIGKFQVLQHRAVDMWIECELAKSLALLAAIRADATDERERRRAVSAAKSQVGRAGRLVSQGAIQLHGGMGMMDEVAASHYAKRLTMIDFQLGSREEHLERFIANP